MELKTTAVVIRCYGDGNLYLDHTVYIDHASAAELNDKIAFNCDMITKYRKSVDKAEFLKIL